MVDIPAVWLLLLLPGVFALGFVAAALLCMARENEPGREARADALDIAVAALRSIKMCAMETDVETVAIEALRQIGAEK